MSENKAKVAKTGAAKATAQAAKRVPSVSKSSEAAHGAHGAGTEAARVMAESAMAKSREAYEQAKDAMEGGVEMLEASLDKAGQGVSEMNRKVIDITQTNLNAGFDLARSLAGAKDLAEVIDIQSAFARKQFESLAAQAQDVRTLAVKLSSDAVEPFKTQLSRTMKVFDAAH